MEFSLVLFRSSCSCVSRRPPIRSPQVITARLYHRATCQPLALGASLRRRPHPGPLSRSTLFRLSRGADASSSVERLRKSTSSPARSGPQTSEVFTLIERAAHGETLEVFRSSLAGETRPLGRRPRLLGHAFRLPLVAHPNTSEAPLTEPPLLATVAETRTLEVPATQVRRLTPAADANPLEGLPTGLLLPASAAAPDTPSSLSSPSVTITPHGVRCPACGQLMQRQATLPPHGRSPP